MQEKKQKIGVYIYIVLSLAIIGVGGYLAYTNLTKSNYVMGCLGIVVLLLGVILISYLILTYNKFVRYKQKVNESLALIDVQLKLRFDLIPNLVNTVKGYTKHEQQVFSEIAELRKRALETNIEKEKIELGNQTLPKLRQIIAIAENYPKLQADALYKSLMEELVLVEDKIVASRRFYDSNVNIYNTSIEVWPSNIFAKMFNFDKVELYRIDAGERLNVRID